MTEKGAEAGLPQSCAATSGRAKTRMEAAWLRPETQSMLDLHRAAIPTLTDPGNGVGRSSQSRGNSERESLSHWGSWLPGRAFPTSIWVSNPNATELGHENGRRGPRDIASAAGSVGRWRAAARLGRPSTASSVLSREAESPDYEQLPDFNKISDVWLPV